MMNGLGASNFHEDLRVVSDNPRRIESYIPASTVQTHASNLLILKGGDILCAWFGGSQEGNADISIYLSHLTPGAQKWTSPQKISDDSHRSEQNPVLFQDPETSDIWIFYTAQEAGHQDKAIVRRRISTDQGHTWSTAVQVFPEVGAFVRQPIVVLPDKTWVLPIWYCRTAAGTQWNGNDDISAVRYSRDSGKTWSESIVPESRGCVHMAIRRLPDGSYGSFFRSRWADNVYFSASSDGINWSRPEATVLPNPNSGIAFGVLPDGRLVLVFNDSAATPGMKRRQGLYDDIESEGPALQKQPAIDGKEAIWGAPRSNLTLGISNDGGKTWKARGLLEQGDGFCLTNNSKEKINREISYPSIAVGEDGTIHIAYSYFRQRIKYVRVNEKYATE